MFTLINTTMSRTNRYIKTEKELSKRGLKAKARKGRKEVKDLLNIKNFTIFDAETIIESLNE
jgi:hypothetical protein